MLAQETMEPLLKQLETLEGTVNGDYTDDDKITLMAVAKANAVSYAIVQRLLMRVGVPRNIDALAKASAKATANQYMKQYDQEEQAWLKMRSN